MSDSDNKFAAFLYISAWASALMPVFILALALIEDNDVWWHMKCGEMLLKEHWNPCLKNFSGAIPEYK